MAELFSKCCIHAVTAGAALLLAACQVTRDTPLTASPDQTPTHSIASQIELPPTVSRISSPAVLEACDVNLQAQALRVDYQPDWPTLGLDTCYELSFNLTAGGPDYAGTARITFTNPSSIPLDDLVLRTYPNAEGLYGGRLEILSAAANDQIIDVEDYLPDGTAARLALSQPLSPGQTLLLELEFAGTMPIDFGAEQTYGIFNYTSDGPVIALANAYPMLAPREDGRWRVDPVQAIGDAVLSQTALYRVTVSTPLGWQVAATGRQLAVGEKDGLISTEFAGGPVREFMLAASPVFVVHEVKKDDLLIRHWGYSATEPGREEAEKVALDALELFEDNFGPLPYNELDIVAMPLRNASGVEYPGLILIGEGLYSNTNTPNRLPNVVAHEVAHQWWYSVVGSDVLRHPWQDEALATFSAQLYAKAHNPAYYTGARANYEQAVKNMEAEIGAQDVDQPVDRFIANPSAYAPVVYLKGNLFLEAVWEKTGEADFFNALNEYYSANQYGEAEPADLLDAFENACECSLDGLYEEWGVQD